SATSDEVAHIPAGYSYWQYFDYKINPEHPPLVKLWATLPLLILHPTLPTSEYWERGDQWEFGRQFLYWSGNDADQIYFWTRLMIVLIGVLLGWYIYRLATELYGWKAGLLALLLYVLDPNIITHSTIVQTDIPISAGIFILTYYFWKYIQQKESLWHWKQIAVLGILVGICFAVKYTGVYVVGFLVILYFVHLALEWYTHEHKKEELKDDFFAKLTGFYHALSSEEGQKELASAGIAFAKILFIGVIILAATYGFVNFNWYFVGFNNVVLHSTEGHPAYLLGMNSQTGWWYYFIVAFLVKTPIATILLIAASLFVFFKTAASKTNTQLKNELFLLVPAALYFILFMLNGINIGLRHILPVYPFLFVFIGSLFHADWKLFGEKISLSLKYAPYILGVLLGWLIIANIMIYPYYIAYFNEFTGGPSHGYEYLLDSNLDWGQGLKDTAVWLSDHGYLNQTIRMTYFGSEDPAYRGIKSINTPCAPTPGIVVISVDRVYDFMGNQKGCAEWLKNYEPVAIIDYSIWIYDIEDPTVIANYNQCKQDCSKGCSNNGQVYGDSVYTTKCVCICQDATNTDLGIL
ncbi:glycosyltransferase family 39 protein, partial [Candidatus Woesearchaeota archaeon]|nr:glycosyltransferase family 39 protein [Candidatus Woesearchaeota archaeon]